MVCSVAKVVPVPVLTVMFAVPPFSAIDASSTEKTSAGASSSSVMVPMAVASERVAPPWEGLLNVTEKTSLFSSILS